MAFYSNKSKAAVMAGVSESIITQEMQESIDTWVETNIKWDGFNGEKNNDEYYDILKSNQSELVLKHFPILSISEVTDNASSSNSKILNTSSYGFDAESGILHLLNVVPENVDDTYIIYSFTRGNRTVRVKYVSGYSTVPDVIVKLSTLMLARWAEIKNVLNTSQAENLKSVKIGDYTETYDLNFSNVKSKFDDVLVPMIKRVKQYYTEGV